LGNVTLARFGVTLDGVDRERTQGSARRRVVESNAQVGDFGEAKTGWHDQELNSVRALYPFQYVVEVKYQGSGALFPFNDAHCVDMIVMPRHLVELRVRPRPASHGFRRQG